MSASTFAGYSEKKIKAALAVCEALRAFMEDDSGPADRESLLTAQYGECVTQAKAARILDKHPSTIHEMLGDGRLERVCGNKVDVRSIARYMDAPRDSNFRARVAKQDRGKPSRFRVV